MSAGGTPSSESSTELDDNDRTLPFGSAKPAVETLDAEGYEGSQDPPQPEQAPFRPHSRMGQFQTSSPEKWSKTLSAVFKGLKGLWFIAIVAGLLATTIDWWFDPGKGQPGSQVRIFEDTTLWIIIATGSIAILVLLTQPKNAVLATANAAAIALATVISAVTLLLGLPSKIILQLGQRTVLSVEVQRARSGTEDPWIAVVDYIPVIVGLMAATFAFASLTKMIGNMSKNSESP